MMYSIVSMCALLLVATTANADSSFGITSNHMNLIEKVLPESQFKSLSGATVQQTPDLGPFFACVMAIGEPPAVCEDDVQLCANAGTFDTCFNFIAAALTCVPLMPVDPNTPVDPYEPKFADMTPAMLRSIFAAGCIKDFGGNYCSEVVPGGPSDYLNPAVTHTCEEAAQYGCCLEVAFGTYTTSGLVANTATSFPGCDIPAACPSGGETSTVVKGTVAVDCLSSSYMTMQETQRSAGNLNLMAADMIMGALERDIANIASVQADYVYVTAWNKTALDVVYFDYTVGGLVATATMTVAQIEANAVTALTNSTNWSFPEMEAEGIIQPNTAWMYNCNSNSYSYDAVATVAPATVQFTSPVSFSAAGVVVPSMFMLLLAVAAAIMA